MSRLPPLLHNSYESRLRRKLAQLRWQHLHLDPILLCLLFALALFGFFILYSASNQDWGMMGRQMAHLGAAFIVMFIVAQIPPKYYQQWSPWFFVGALLLLAAVLVIGKVDKGARRWIDIGFLQLQPSEFMKLAMPMMLAYFFHDKTLPPKTSVLLIAGLTVLIPVLLTAKEPDLGTAIMIAAAGFSVILLAGLSGRLLAICAGLGLLGAPILWHFMHGYQRDRVLTFLNPERDPLGRGYHIIQSKIAIGSGGFFGKGWLEGTQSHLQFLPEHTTDFIFAVNAEELGFLGCLALLSLFVAISGRCLWISMNAQDTYTRLLGGSLSITFLLSAFINIGMVVGILPVVGIPLPLISYGGSSLVTILAGFGIIMSIQTHRRLWSS